MSLEQRTMKGFSLVEILIVLTIFTILLMMAVPNARLYNENSKVRNAAEAIMSGLQKARAYAIQRNTPTEIVFNVATRTWTINGFDTTVSPPSATQIETLNWGDKVAVTLNPAGQTRVTFDGVGRMLRNNITAPNNITESTQPVENIRVQSASTLEGARRLQVDVSMMGGIRLCDLDLPATDPKSCGFSAIP